MSNEQVQVVSQFDTPTIFIFVALACEAKALVKHWHLKKQQQEPFLLFSDDRRVLVVTGIGKIAMAGAIAHTMALFKTPQPILLNFGIAGHPMHSLGEIYLADKIVNAETGKCYYPQLTAVSFLNTAMLTTVAQPQTSYLEISMYYMEAAGFFEMATKFTSSELIHSLKVVSDNALSAIENINEDLVNQWLAVALTPLESLCLELMVFQQKLPLVNDSLFNELSTLVHFTASNSSKLKKLSQNWELLIPNIPLDLENHSIKNSKELLNYLEFKLAKTEFYL